MNSLPSGGIPIKYRGPGTLLSIALYNIYCRYTVLNSLVVSYFAFLTAPSTAAPTQVVDNEHSNDGRFRGPGVGSTLYGSRITGFIFGQYSTILKYLILGNNGGKISSDYQFTGVGDDSDEEVANNAFTTIFDMITTNDIDVMPILTMVNEMKGRSTSSLGITQSTPLMGITQSSSKKYNLYNYLNDLKTKIESIQYKIVFMSENNLLLIIIDLH